MGVAEEEIVLAGRHYCLVLPRLESACMALSWMRMVGLTRCLVSVANLVRLRNQSNSLNIKAERNG